MDGHQSDNPAPTPSRRSHVRDVLIGSTFGVVFAILWVVALMMMRPPERAMFNFFTRQVEYGEVGATYYKVPFSDFSLRNLGLGCLVVFGFIALVAGGLLLGTLLGGAVGAFVGGLTGYFGPFIGWGVYIQRKIGWSRWLGIETGNHHSQSQP